MGNTGEIVSRRRRFRRLVSNGNCSFPFRWSQGATAFPFVQPHESCATNSVRLRAVVGMQRLQMYGRISIR